MSRQANPVPAAALPATHPVRIGIFDSGVGGLSVMQAIRRRLPDAELLYAADTAYAPYGDRSEEFLCDRSTRIARFLRDQGAGPGSLPVVAFGVLGGVRRHTRIDTAYVNVNCLRSSAS